MPLCDFMDFKSVRRLCRLIIIISTPSQPVSLYGCTGLLLNLCCYIAVCLSSKQNSSSHATIHSYFQSDATQLVFIARCYGKARYYRLSSAGVRMSITLVFCIQMNKDIIQLFSWPVRISPIILVFKTKRYYTSPS